METPKYGYLMPPDWSLHGAAIDQIIDVVHIFMFVLFIGWGIFLLYCLIKYRRREGHKASYESNSSKLPKYAEIAVVVFEIFLLVGLSLPVWSKYKQDFPDAKTSLEVRVVGQQFVWNIHYPGVDQKFGRSEPKLMSDSNPLGIDPADPASADDVVTVNQFHLPINKPVIAHISSKDVIHSFGVPVLRLKQDAIPGMTVPIWFVATQAGISEIVCSQLCGVGHSLMKGIVTSEKPEDFEKWYKEQPRPFATQKTAQAKNPQESGHE